MVLTLAHTTDEDLQPGQIHSESSLAFFHQHERSRIRLCPLRLPVWRWYATHPPPTQHLTHNISLVVCKLHVSFHGCQQSYSTIDDVFIVHNGLNEWAESNNVHTLPPLCPQPLQHPSPNSFLNIRLLCCTRRPPPPLSPRRTPKAASIGGDTPMATTPPRLARKWPL